jgi:hypothetical protein
MIGLFSDAGPRMRSSRTDHIKHRIDNSFSRVLVKRGG